MALIVQSCFVENNVDIIGHKFLISGHPFSPNDREFVVVEMALKKKSVQFVPRDFYNII